MWTCLAKAVLTGPEYACITEPLLIQENTKYLIPILHTSRYLYTKHNIRSDKHSTLGRDTKYQSFMSTTLEDRRTTLLLVGIQQWRASPLNTISLAEQCRSGMFRQTTTKTKIVLKVQDIRILGHTFLARSGLREKQHPSHHRSETQEEPHDLDVCL